MLNNGNKRYQDILAEMPDEERKEYVAKRKAERDLKKLMKMKLEEQADELTDKLLSKARWLIDNDDSPAGFSQVWDRVVGKPQDNVDVTSGGKEIPLMNVRVAKQDDDG